MHEQRKSSGDLGEENQTPESEDSKWQSAVLNVLLDAHPEPFTKGELAAAMLKADAGFSERDELARAIKELITVGLVHQNGIVLLPSRAAVHYEKLETGS
jgi:hypothetical protein